MRSSTSRVLLAFIKEPSWPLEHKRPLRRTLSVFRFVWMRSWMSSFASSSSRTKVPRDICDLQQATLDVDGVDCPDEFATHRLIHNIRSKTQRISEVTQATLTQLAKGGKCCGSDSHESPRFVACSPPFRFTYTILAASWRITILFEALDNVCSNGRLIWHFLQLLTLFQRSITCWLQSRMAPTLTVSVDGIWAVIMVMLSRQSHFLCRLDCCC